MRKEIEVKARLHDRDRVTNNLQQLGCVLSEPVVQDDVIFVASDYGQFDQFNPGKNVLRIRKTKTKTLFTLKQPQGNELACIERETEINDAGEMREALLLMGYKEAVEVHKTRQKTNYNHYEICLDDVEGLGSFIEVEKITDTEDEDAVQKELFDFLISLGVDPNDRVTRGYDTLVFLEQKKATHDA